MSIQHRGYARVLRELAALQNKLFGSTKFEQLLRYRRADLFYLVLPNELVCESEFPLPLGRAHRKRERLGSFAKTRSSENHGATAISFLATNRPPAPGT